jgi:DNA adenine methylase
MSSAFHSPLRYPGGKAALAPLLAQIIHLNKLTNVVYVEPYAGGAGAALSLLMSEQVTRIVINDLDPRISSFWTSLLRFPERFIDLVRTTPITIDEWRRQQDIYINYRRHSSLRIGFATFFLNRCNRSGILVMGGPIGGYGQEGRWKLNARFNRDELCDRLKRIAAYRDRIKVSGLDALDFLRTIAEPIAECETVLAYLDPPYFVKGSNLYYNSYTGDAHAKVARYLLESCPFRWILSYDNVAEISDLYREVRRVPFDLSYTAYHWRAGRELMISRLDLRLPDDVQSWIAGRRRPYPSAPKEGETHC